MAEAVSEAEKAAEVMDRILEREDDPDKAVDKLIDHPKVKWSGIEEGRHVRLRFADGSILDIYIGAVRIEYWITT